MLFPVHAVPETKMPLVLCLLFVNAFCSTRSDSLQVYSYNFLPDIVHSSLLRRLLALLLLLTPSIAS